MPESSGKTVERRRIDVVSGDLRKTVFFLALPVLCEQFLSFCVGFVDTWLSGTISTEATNTVGIAAYVGWLASMFFGLVGAGTTALVSRFWGAGDFDEANRATSRSMTLAALIGALFYALVFISAPEIARLLGFGNGSNTVVARYLRLDGIGHLFTSLSLIGAAALRGAGDMRSPMMILGLVNLLNIVISATLVFGIGPLPVLGIHSALVRPIGIDGIVIGTVVARFVGGMLMVAGLSRGLGGLRLSRRELKLRGEMTRRILRIGGPAAVDGAIMWGGQFLFLMVIANLAAGALKESIFAAHIIGVRMEAITYLPAVAWGSAAATIVGQSLGTGRRQRAVRAGHEAVLQCSIMAAGITVLFYVGAPAIYALMHKELLVSEVGVPAFRMLSFFQVPLVISIIYVMALRGAGDTRFPLLMTILGVLCVRLPVAYFCGIVLEGGLIGAWIGMCADMALRAVLATLRYVFGRWVETIV